MKETIKETIKKIYIDKNYNFFLEKCATNLILPKEIEICSKNYNYKIVEFFEDKEPSKKWSFHSEKLIMGEFEVTYTIVLEISKIASLFYVQHEFRVTNKDNNAIEPVLEGFGGQPYTKNQLEIHNKIASILEKNGYEELFYSDMIEVFLGLEELSEFNIFGNQATVENVLFHDIYDLESKI